MVTESVSDRIAKVDKLYDEVNRGQTSEAILRILDPLIEARLGRLLAEFDNCPPELGPLLNLKVRISEIWRIRKELRDGVKLGLSAQRLLEAVTKK